MKSEEVREKFKKFFEEKKHAWVSSSSLVPDDPSVLLTTAGMQQFKPYFVGKADPMKDFGARNTASIQKCFRTSDIDEVGDESHLTFFEMSGNFSFGGYFKKEAIEYAHEFITKELGLKIDYVSVFEGDTEVPADTESEKVWKSLGIKDIRRFGRKDNFWGPTGSEGPCGPTTEIYVNSALRQAQGKTAVEVWNLVFNEYYCKPDGKLEKLKTPGVDTGMGFERLMMMVQNVPTIFETDLFSPISKHVTSSTELKLRRIITDHARAITFLIADGVRPSNKEAGYILRRLVRRLIVHEREIGDVEELFDATHKEYSMFYSNLDRSKVMREFSLERERFLKTLDAGLKALATSKLPAAASPKKLAELAFDLYQSYGLPIEVTIEELKKKGASFDVAALRKEFDAIFSKHQNTSRAGAEKKFGGHGLILNTGELKAGDETELQKVTRLHTATHLLQWALREVLGKDVKQAGSDITVERTRFDFTFPRKMAPEEIKKVENLVNQKIKDDLPVSFKEMPKEEAEKTGSLFFFKEKYPEKVKVYFIGPSIEKAVSKEFCGGPHVTHTVEIGEFKIAKEEAVGAGVRRVRGVVKP